MQNLEQIRAKNALNAANDATFSGKANGEVIKKVPTLIQQNGILAALAFASETKKAGELKNPGHALVFASIFLHCAERNLLKKNANLTLKELANRGADLKNLMDDMSRQLFSGDSASLRNVTSEALAFLNYLRRFAKKDSE